MEIVTEERPAVKLGFQNLTPQQYHSQCGLNTPALSASIAKLLVNKTPAHAWQYHPLLGGSHTPVTEAMEFGTLFHEMALGRADNIAIGDFDTWQTKAAKQFKADAEAEGKIAVKAGKMAVFNAMRKAFARQVSSSEARDFYSYEEYAMTEAVAYWEYDGVICKTMFDRVIAEAGLIFDIKTCTDASPAACQRKIVSMGYDIQAEFYRMALETLEPGCNPRFTFLFVETSSPWIMTPVELSPESAKIGRAKALRAIELWRECLAYDIWPGYSSKIVQVDPKPWDVAAAMECEDME